MNLIKLLNSMDTILTNSSDKYVALSNLSI